LVSFDLNGRFPKVSRRFRQDSPRNLPAGIVPGFRRKETRPGHSRRRVKVRSIMEQSRSVLAGKPVSANSGLCSLVGLIGFLGCLAWFPSSGLSNVNRAVVAILATTIPMVLYEVLVGKVHRRPSTGLDWSEQPSRGEAEPLRCVIKLLGFAATLAVI